MGVLACRISQCLFCKDSIQLTGRFYRASLGFSRKPHRSVDVEVGVPGSLGGVKAVLVLRSCGPGGVGGRRGHHHEEGLVAGFVLQEVQRHVCLRGNEKKRHFQHRRFVVCLYFVSFFFFLFPPHQHVCQVVSAVVCSVFLRLPVHRHGVVVVFRVPLLKTEKTSFRQKVNPINHNQKYV